VLTGVRTAIVFSPFPQRQPRAPWRRVVGRVVFDFRRGAWISASRNEIESDGRESSSLVMVKVFARGETVERH
jgi:hypothetical protein